MHVKHQTQCLAHRDTQWLFVGCDNKDGLKYLRKKFSPVRAFIDGRQEGVGKYMNEIWLQFWPIRKKSKKKDMHYLIYFHNIYVCMLVTQQCPTICGAIVCPWYFLGKNTGMGSHSLLQGIFLTQGLNPGLPHRRQILYHLRYLGSWCLVIINNLLLVWLACLFST